MSRPIIIAIFPSVTGICSALIPLFDPSLSPRNSILIAKKWCWHVDCVVCNVIAPPASCSACVIHQLSSRLCWSTGLNRQISSKYLLTLNFTENISPVDFSKYEGSSESFRTFIFSRETVRAGGVVIGRVWECHVTSQSGNPADLAV